MIRRLEYYNLNREKYKIEKANTLHNVREFYKGRRMIIAAFENGVFPLPKQYSSGMHEWKE